MKFTVFTHVDHIEEGKLFYAYGPYVSEMNIWSKYADELIIVAPITNSKLSSISLHYDHPKVKFVAIKSFNILSFKSLLRSIFMVPTIIIQIYNAMKSTNHIHIRCPGNIGLIACFVQILFPNKIKTAKYAGNWDSNSKQPLSYQLQKWILNSTVLTKNIKVLVYGEWKDSSKNIKPFFTASYREKDKLIVSPRSLTGKIHFLFVGTLTDGKRPLYAIKIIEQLSKLGFQVDLQLFGEGKEKMALENYCKVNQLEEIIFFKGNESQSVVKNAYINSHFIILPSKSEGWPKVIAEGMFWGCLPISTEVSCLAYMLDNANRGLFLKLNLEEDVSQIVSLLNDQTTYNLKVAQSIEWSRKFTLDLFENEIKLMMH